MKQAAQKSRFLRSLVRPLVRGLAAYVPGEQPRVQGLIKLNTNENPYPPSPKVRRAIRAAVDARLRLYPPPTAQPLRERLARLHRCQPENILVSNGCDEALALATRAFAEPKAEQAPQDFGPAANAGDGTSAAKELGSRRTGERPTPLCSRSTVQFFTPSYSLYPVLANIHGARTNAIGLRSDFGLPSLHELSGLGWDFHAALTFITTPNAPSGRAYTVGELAKLCEAQRGVVVLDETYVDFAKENALCLAQTFPHVLAARSFSKAYALCFLRVGYVIGHAELIAALDKIRDSYNVNGLAQVAALATLDDLPYYRKNFRRIAATRGRLARELRGLGFEVLPSQANFLLARPPAWPAKTWLEKLRERMILVRWFHYPQVQDYLRISIGTDREAGALLRAARDILAEARRDRR